MQTRARPVTLRNMPAGVSTLSSDGWARSEHLLCIPTFVLTAPRLRPRERAKDRFWAAVTAERLADMAHAAFVTVHSTLLATVYRNRAVGFHTLCRRAACADSGRFLQPL